ncbi:TP0733 family outer membrane beta-barrel protein [Spirochaeta dissipatitropha]
MNRHRVFFYSQCLVIFFALTAVSFGQEISQADLFDQDLGDQQFSIRLGLFKPLFFYGPEGMSDSNMKFGGSGALRWNAYVNNSFSTGVGLSGSIANNVNNEPLYQVNITSANSFYFLRAYPFFFPLLLDGGIQFTRFQDILYAGPMLKPGISALYATDSGWAFGLTANYWIVPEIYLGENGPPAEHSRTANQIELSLTALYHF